MSHTLIKSNLELHVSEVAYDQLKGFERLRRVYSPCPPVVVPEREKLGEEICFQIN